MQRYIFKLYLPSEQNDYIIAILEADSKKQLLEKILEKYGEGCKIVTSRIRIVYNPTINSSHDED
jgi:hypothetical protein